MTPPGEPPRHPPAEARTLERAFELDHAPARVWRALSDPGRLARWLLPFDAETGPAARIEAGASFSLVMPEGEGRIDCEVIAVEPGRRLACTWRTHADRDPRPAVAVDAVVTFEVEPLAGGRTRLLIRQVGVPAGAPTMLGAGALALAA